MYTGLSEVTQQQALVLEKQALTHSYPVRCLIALDVLCNVALLRGRLDETISAHSARAALEGKRWGILVSKFLSFFQKNHGVGAILGDEVRADAIAEVESKMDIIN